MFVFYFLHMAQLFAQPSIDHVSGLEAVIEGEKRKLLHRYTPTDSFVQSRKVTDHPLRGKGPGIIIPIVGESFLAVVHDKRVSFDFDKDGVIQPDERYDMLEKDGEFRAIVPLPIPRSKNQGSAHVVFVSTNLDKNLGYIEDMKRKGVLWDGTTFYLHSVAGDFRHRKATLVLDVDGDGVSDVHHLQYKSFLNGRGITWNNGVWVPRLSLDGDTIEWTRFEDARIQIGKKAPLFDVVDIRKKKHRSAEYINARVVLDFWATWCASCVRDHKKLKKLQKRYGLSIIGIAQNHPRDIRRYAKKKKIPWPQVSLEDYPQLKEQFFVEVLPTYALIDEKGILVFLGSRKGLEQTLIEMR